MPEFALYFFKDHKLVFLIHYAQNQLNEDPIRALKTNLNQVSSLKSVRRYHDPTSLSNSRRIEDINFDAL